MLSLFCAALPRSQVFQDVDRKKIPRIRAYAKDLRPTAASTEEVKLPDSSHLKKIGGWSLKLL